MNNKERSALDCEIVRDLLPLYCDDVVSKTTKAAVKEHLEKCSSCRSEYELLREDIPIEERENTTKNKFLGMIGRQRKKRIFITAIIVFAACALLIGAFFGQRELYISEVPGDELTLYGVYRYSTYTGYKYFVMFSMPCYDYAKVETASVHDGENGYVLEISVKKPLITQKHEELGSPVRIFVYECGYWSGDDGVELVEFDSVKLAGELIWSREANENDEVPDYVYAYDEFENPFGTVSSWTVAESEGYLGAGYTDGRRVLWDFEGNVIYDGY